MNLRQVLCVTNSSRLRLLSFLSVKFLHKPTNFQRLAILLILLLLAFYLRTYRLDSQSLRGDEAATVIYSALPISQLWENSRVTDPHPPLYYLMLHPWQWLAGEEAWVMRFAGVTASTLTVAALYGLAQYTLRRLNISLMAAALLAINPLQIWLAQDIRSYPFFTLFGLLSSWALVRALRKSSQYPYRWLLYILFTFICFYIHYYTVFLIAFQGLFILFNGQKFWSKRWPWLASQIAIGLLIIPGLQLGYNFIGQAAGGIEKISTPILLRLASTALLTGFTIDDRWGLAVSLLLAPVWITGMVIILRREPTPGLFWSLFFAIPVIGVITLSIDRPFFKERFLIQAQPAFELLLAIGFLSLWQHVHRQRNTKYALRLIAAFLFALLLFANSLALSNYFANPVYAKAPPWHLFHDYIKQKAKANDVMLTNFPEAAVSYYSPNGLPFYVVPAERDRSVEFRLEQTEEIANAYERIWFLPLLNQGFDEHGDVLNWLDRHADRVNQVFFPSYNINLYLSPPAIDASLIHQPATFAHGIQLRGFQIFDQQGKSRLKPVSEAQQEFVLTLKPEDDFTLSLYWVADGPTDEAYTVFTHLIAADGFNRTSRDNQPVWGTFPTTMWSPGEKIADKYTLTIPPGTPSGNHRLQVGWYQSDTLERVPVLDKVGEPIADHVILNIIIRVE